METILIVLLLVGFSFLVAQMSKEKDIGFWTLFAICMIFSPMVGLIVALFKKKRVSDQEPIKEINWNEVKSREEG